ARRPSPADADCQRPLTTWLVPASCSRVLQTAISGARRPSPADADCQRPLTTWLVPASCSRVLQTAIS
ncbi:hypothetical protein CJ307_35860, partial [Klebsiella quasipneumoniae]